MRVALLPTGRTEWHGLPRALQTLFPEHEFYALPDEALFRSQHGPYASFTSSELTARSDDAGQGPSDRAAELVGYAAQAARGDRRGAARRRSRSSTGAPSSSTRACATSARCSRIWPMRSASRCPRWSRPGRRPQRRASATGRRTTCSATCSRRG